MTALIIGSIVPDFEYFFRMHIYSVHSHTVAGLFYFDLTVGCLLFILFVQVVRHPLLMHLPDFLRTRVSFDDAQRTRRYRFENGVIIVFSLLIGAASHLLWDSFTHASGYCVRHISFLRKNVFIENFKIPVYKLLQHGSTVVGFLALFIYVIALPRKTVSPAKGRGSYWWITGGVGIVVLLLMFMFNGSVTAGQYIVAGVTGLLLGLVIASIVQTINNVQ
jgi:hypothetical protein